MDDPKKTAAFNLLRKGMAKKTCHDYPAAQRLFEQALIAVREGKLPNGDGFIGLTLRQLGVVAERVQDHAAEQRYYAEIVAHRRKISGKSHPDVGIALRELGLVLTRQAKFAEAVQVTEEALDILRSAYGDDHLSVVDTLKLLGSVLDSLGRRGEGQRRRRRALVILSGLIELAEREGDTQEVTLCYTRFAAILREILGNQHPGVGAALRKLAGALIDNDELAKGYQVMKAALDIFRAAKIHFEVADTLLALARLAKRMKDPDAARGYFTEFVKIPREIQANEYLRAEALRELGVSWIGARLRKDIKR